MANKNKFCKHKNTKLGPKITTFYGAFTTEICLQCKKWRKREDGSKWTSKKMDLSEDEM